MTSVRRTARRTQHAPTLRHATTSAKHAVGTTASGGHGSFAMRGKIGSPRKTEPHCKTIAFFRAPLRAPPRAPSRHTRLPVEGRRQTTVTDATLPTATHLQRQSLCYQLLDPAFHLRFQNLRASFGERLGRRRPGRGNTPWNVLVCWVCAHCSYDIGAVGTANT